MTRIAEDKEGIHVRGNFTVAETFVLECLQIN